MSSLLRSLSLLLASGLCLPSAALAYTIVLRDGARVEARGPYEVDGDRALITLAAGTRTFLPLAEIDRERTAALNRDAHDGAILISRGEEQAPQATPRRRETRSLVDAAAAERSTFGSRPAAPATPAPSHGTTRPGRDLAALPRQPYGDRDVSRLLRRHFQQHRAAEVEILRGSREGRVLVTVETNTEGETFRALVLGATALELVTAAAPGIEAVELLLQTGEGQAAGQFVLTPASVRPLLDGEIDVSDFYVQYVLF